MLCENSVRNTNPKSLQVVQAQSVCVYVCVAWVCVCVWHGCVCVCVCGRGVCVCGVGVCVCVVWVCLCVQVYSRWVCGT